jgi:hypothetical protein
VLVAALADDATHAQDDGDDDDTAAVVVIGAHEEPSVGFACSSKVFCFFTIKLPSGLSG